MKGARSLLFPASVIYSGILSARNWMYDKNLIKSASFNFPIICIGNLATGGTGKTPMVEYLIRLLMDEFNTATLSRGYKRKTKGFAIADPTTTALEIGDEPMQFHKKFPRVTVAVGEERLVAIPQLLHERQETQVIILDDAFQHRHVRAGLNIILTEFKNLYTHDQVLPAGNLRDVRSSIKRAHIIVVTKCRPNMDLQEKQRVIKELHSSGDQKIFFTFIDYSDPYHLFSNNEIQLTPASNVLLITGIANPKPLEEMLHERNVACEVLRYADHHIFSIDDLQFIKKSFEKISSDNKIILTTEKDAVRLEKFETELKEYPIYVLPMRHSFLFGEAEAFNSLVKKFVASFKN